MASNSLTNTNVSDTYVGVLHAQGQALPPSGKADIYDGAGNKSALSVGRDGQGVEVDGELGPKFAAAIADVIYPVGSLFFSTDNTNPGTRMAGTGWVQVAEGKFLAGVGTGTDNNGASHTVTGGDTDTTGEYDHTLTEAEMPAHRHLGGAADRGISIFAHGAEPLATRTTHSIDTGGTDGDHVGYTTYTGTGTAHNNLPPAFGMYVWERTS